MMTLQQWAEVYSSLEMGTPATVAEIQSYSSDTLHIMGWEPASGAPNQIDGEG